MKTIEAPRNQVSGPAASAGLPLPRFHLTFHRKPLPAGTTAETVLDAVERTLRRRGRARGVIRGVDRIDFVGPSPAQGGTGLLAYATGPGVVWIEREGEAFHVRYELGFQPVYMGGSAGAAVAVLLAWLAGDPEMVVTAFLFVALLSVLAMVFTVVNFDTGLRKAVLDAVESHA
jgi:hypothetical protein